MAFPGEPFSALTPLTALGIILALGILGGQIARRSQQVPTLTGYIITGLIIGPHGLNLLSQSMIDASCMFVQLALGIALFELGRRVDLHWLHRERALLRTALLVSALCFATFFATTLLFGETLQTAGLIASLTLACSPAIILEVIRESRAEGQVSERIIAFAGIANLLALTGFSLAIGLARLHSGMPVEDFLLQPAWMLLGSALAGLIAGQLAIHLGHWIGARYHEAQEVLLFALIALTVGLCYSLHMLPALALLIFGLSTRNLPRGYAVSSPYLNRHSVIFFAALFVTAGTRLDLHMLYNHLYLAPLLVGLRTGLQALGCLIMAQANGLSKKNGVLMGLGLMPMSSSVAALLLMSTPFLPQDNLSVVPILVAMLCLTELLAPVVTWQALRWARETREDN